MGKREIKLNYDKAIRQAERLETIGKEVDTMAQNDYDNTLNGIAGAWSGENAAAYLERAGQLKEKMITTAKNILLVADEIRRKAKRIFDAEMAALEIAESRTYAGGGSGSPG
ncbi:MAG: hypothetical protein IKO11_04715 [Lachnospiraceae bacterium]|nr:hypothetical protein [Lachnospiraceae bacterium]